MQIIDSKHLKVDECTRQRTEEITEAILKSIQQSVAETGQQQQQIAADADSRVTELENNFKTRIEEHVRQLEKEKDALIDKLEEELRARQKIITETTFEDMNNQIKEIRSIFDVHGKAEAQAVTLGLEETSDRLASITRTVFTTEVTAASGARADDDAAGGEEITKQIKSSK